MTTDYIRHLQRKNAPVGAIRAPHPHSGVEWEKELAEGRAKRAHRHEEERKDAAAAKPAFAGQSEAATVKREPGPPALSYEQSSAQRAVFRHACDWFELHHLCANANCRRAKSCRGEPMACLRVRIPQVPESARTFVRLMIEGQEFGLSFEEAFEDAGEFAESWAGWIAGLQAASRPETASKGPKTRP